MYNNDNNNIKLGQHMYTVHGQGADLPHFLHFGHGPILVQINMQHSQAQPYALTLFT